jgi:hypothetical protein
MGLALGATAIVLLVLASELMLPRLRTALVGHRTQPRHRSEPDYDPGRELRAEQRARALLRSCVNREDWEMYRDLGFLRVWGKLGGSPNSGPSSDPADRRGTTAPAGALYAYLIYPHKPIVAYLPRTGTLLNEYCVAFPDHTRPYGSSRLPDSDDVLAKWMALTADERRLIADANMHLPGRQVDPEQVQRDLARLVRWEAERSKQAPRASLA